MKRLGVIFFTYARFLIKITNTSQTARSGSQHFLGKISNPLLFCNKSFDQKTPDALALGGFSMFGVTILFLYQSRDLQLMDTKHVSDLSVVGSYIYYIRWSVTHGIGVKRYIYYAGLPRLCFTKWKRCNI